MKKIIKGGIYGLFLVLLGANIFIFVSEMNMGQKINELDRATKKIKQENIDLETKLYNENSLQFAEAMAKELNYTESAKPYYLENLGFAKK